MTENILSIQNLTVDFESELGSQRALNGINLDVKRSRTTAIVGESGSGKSVTAFSILQLIRRPGKINSGAISFNPRNSAPFDILSLRENSPELLDLRGGEISMVFQEPMTALSPVHTIGNQVMEAILTHQQLPEKEAFDKSVEMLERVGINDAKQRMYQYPFEFSGGMRQRVVIAMALVAEPELLICDEPTTALDVTVQAEILALIRELKASLDMSVIFITHDLGVVAQIADDIAVMHRGRILETGSVRQILKDPIHPYTKGLIGAVPQSTKVHRLPTISDLLEEGDLDPHELVTLKDGRQVALPLERIQQEHSA